MSWDPYIDTWIVVIGALCAGSCALLGCFLLLRRMSMMGDAISHAVLPGLAIAFLMTSSRASIPMFIGAAVIGVLTAALTQWIHKLGSVRVDAAMGVVFTTMFALGLVLIEQAAQAGKVDLDPGCVLFGAIELTPQKSILFGSFEVPQAAIVLSGLFVVNVGVVAALWKEFVISAFDADLADAQGLRANIMHTLLMVLVAVTTVAAFEAIGSILVIAMLIVPAAIAHLLTDRMLPMVIVSVGVGVVGAVLGHVGAIVVPPWVGFESTSTAGMMATALGALFVLTMLLAPQHGMIARVVRRWRLTLRICREDILGQLYRHDESEASSRAGDVLMAAPWVQHLARRQLVSSGLITSVTSPALTDRGRREALRLVRTHRLWEQFLHEHANVAADHVHDAAHRLEHVTSRGLRTAIDAALQEPVEDPHGKAIPPEPDASVDAP